MVYIPGDDIRYQKAFDDYVKALSRMVIPKRSRDRFSRTLRYTVTIENGRLGKEPHAHALIQKPDYISDADFEDYVKKAMVKNPWMQTGPFALNIQKIDRSPLYLMSYNTKEGHERIAL